MKTFVVLFLLSFSTAKAELVFSDFWIPASPPGLDVFAGYGTIKNTSNKDIIILEFSSKAFSHIEIHKSEIKNGVAKMIKQSSIIIKAHSTFEMKPKSFHLMLFSPKMPLVLNRPITLSSQLKNQSTIKLEALYRKR